MDTELSTKHYSLRQCLMNESMCAVVMWSRLGGDVAEDVSTRGLCDRKGSKTGQKGPNPAKMGPKWDLSDPAWTK